MSDTVPLPIAAAAAHQRYTMLTLPNDILVMILSLRVLNGHDVFCLSRTCKRIMRRIRWLRLTHLSFRVLQGSDLNKIAASCVKDFTSTASLSLTFPLSLESIFSLPNMSNLTSLDLIGDTSKPCESYNGVLFGAEDPVLRNLQKLSLSGPFCHPLSFLNRANWPSGLTHLVLSLNQKHSETSSRPRTRGNQILTVPAADELIDLQRLPPSLEHLSMQLRLLAFPPKRACFVAGQVPQENLRSLRLSFNFPLCDAVHFPTTQHNPFVLCLPKSLTSIDLHALETMRDLLVVNQSVALENVVIRGGGVLQMQPNRVCYDTCALQQFRYILNDVRATRNVCSLHVPQLEVLGAYFNKPDPSNKSGALVMFPNLSSLVIDRVQNTRHLLADWFFQQFRHVAKIDIDEAFAQSLILMDVQLAQLQSVHTALSIRRQKLIVSPCTSCECVKWT